MPKLGKRNLYLVGMAGSGKTTLGKRLAKRLGRKFVDTDAFIEESVGCKISEICDDPKRGLRYLRDRETDLLAGLIDWRGFVVATGGGIVEREENRNMLRTGTVIYLTVPFEVAKLRVREQKRKRGVDRPLFRNMRKAKSLLQKRIPLYGSVACVTVHQKKSHRPDRVAKMILNSIGRK